MPFRDNDRDKDVVTSDGTRVGRIHRVEDENRARVRRHDDDEPGLVFHVHVVYGLTLGMWLGERERRGEVYESPSKEDRPETAPAR